MAPTAGPKETRSLEAVLKNRPDSLLFARLADAYRKDGNISRAIELCVNGLNNYPYYTTGRILLGRCYLEQQKYGEAIEAFTMVCATDRRNQMAIKMLADIFVKQGMEDRAGGLYALLLQMDPSNQTLSNLSAKHGGSRISGDLYAILGIEQAASASADITPAGGHGPLTDSFVPEQQEFTDHTTIEDRNSMFADAHTSEASPFSAGLSIDEQHSSMDISGGDISDRMSTLFGEQASGEASGPAIDSQDSSVGISGGDVADRMSALFGESPATEEQRGGAVSSFNDAASNDFLADALMPDTDSPVSAEPAGVDISNRIDQLFSDDRQTSPQNGEDTFSAAAEVAEPSLHGIDLGTDAMLTGQDFDLSGLSLDSEPPDVTEAPVADASFVNAGGVSRADDVIELLQPGDELTAADCGVHSDSGKVSGADVSNRIEEIFSDGDFGRSAADSITGIPSPFDTGNDSGMPSNAAGFDFDLPAPPEAMGVQPETSFESEPDFEFALDTPETEIDAKEGPGSGTSPELFAPHAESTPENRGDDGSIDSSAFDFSFEKSENQAGGMMTEISTDAEDASGQEGAVSGSDVSDRIDSLFAFGSMPAMFANEATEDESFTSGGAGAVADNSGSVTGEPLEDMLSGSMMQDTNEHFAPAEPSGASPIAGNDDSLFDPDFSEAEFAETMQFDSALFEQMLNPAEEGAAVDAQTPFEADTTDTPSGMVDLTAPPPADVRENFELAPTGHEEFEDTRDRVIEPDRVNMPETTGLHLEGDDEDGHLTGPAIDNDDFQVTTERYRFDGPELVVDNDAPMPSEGTATFEIFRNNDSAEMPELIADAPKEKQEAGPFDISDLLSDQPLTDRLISDHTEVIDLAPSGEDVAGQIDLLFPSDSMPAKVADTGSPEIEVPADIMIGDLLAEEAADVPENNEEDTAYIETMQISREELAAAISREAADLEREEVDGDRVSPLPADDPAPQALLTDGEQTESPPEISGTDVSDRLDFIFPGDDLLSLSSDKAPLPEDDQDDVMESVSEFYTISGDDASQGASIELPDTIADVEFTMESETDAPHSALSPEAVSTADNPRDRTDVEDYGIMEIAGTGSADIELQETAPIDDRDEPFTIPDHVLTPTLADIYFQQGQAHLALRIYERLLKHDPDNDKLLECIEEIRSAIERDELPEPGSDTVKISLPRPRRTTTRAPRKKKAAHDDPAPRPLAGIHLKKQVKNAAKSARKRKH